MDYSLIDNQIDIGRFDKYAAIIGESPSDGARSPNLWNAAFESSGLKYSMVPLDVQKQNIIYLLENLSTDTDFVGGAIAVPYKELTAKWLGDSLTAEAKKIGAVNCLFRDKNGVLKGTNTDGEAALKSFTNNFGSLSSKSVMILGDGGAAKAVSAYFSSNALSTTLISRNVNGQNYAKKINAFWGNWSMINKIIESIDVVINCSSIGYGNQTSVSPLTENQMSKFKDSTIIFDIIYQPTESELLRIAKNVGLDYINGLEMNLEQAVLAYNYTINSNLSLSEIRNLMSKVK